MKKILLVIVLVMSAATLHAQFEGIWEGYDGEWGHVSRQLIALAEVQRFQRHALAPAPGQRPSAVGRGRFPIQERAISPQPLLPGFSGLSQAQHRLL